ncbi:MAG: DUF1849 family protein [Pseudomonadota bacterium]
MRRTALALLGLAAAATAAAETVSYEAEYDLFADRALRGGFEDAYGTMRIARQARCDSVTETQALEAVFVARGEQSFLSQAVTTTTQRDQSRFVMTITQRGLGGETVRRRIAAERADGAVVIAIDGEPIGRAPLETLFPEAFFDAALDAAAEGEAGFDALLFDGVGPDAFFVSVNIGAPQTYAGDHAGEPLRRIAAWPMRAAYFAREDRGARALLNTEALLDADGVVHGAVIPLAPATMQAQLSSLRYLETPAC